MRDYAKIPPQFWIDDMGKKIKALGMESQLIALYLILKTAIRDCSVI